jgi:predicted N-acetyltransferase YhbS
MVIRESTAADCREVLRVEREAFGPEQGAEIEALVTALLDDPTARPALSLIAYEGDRAIGHILFTRVRLTDPESQTPAAILAPLAVAPEAQRRGVGGRLIEEGLRRMAEAGVELVFVLGHPSYYPRHGFVPAGERGFAAPYPIAEENAGAWMVQELREGVIGTVRGVVRCAETLDRPEHWVE